MQWNDSPLRYGAVSRALHWGMALLLAWQFTGMAMKLLLERTPLVAFWVGSHASVGFLLWLLILLRGIWGLSQLGNRPGHRSGLIGRLALLGHLALYGLMLIVPSLALLRAAGGKRAVQFFGVEVRGASPEQVEWMVAPANLAHGTLGWVLLALIVGHIAMVFVHRHWLRDDILPRMAGRAD